MLIPDALLKHFSQLERQEDLRSFLSEVRAASAAVRPEDVQAAIHEEQPREQAAALLCSAAHSFPLDPAQLWTVFRSDSWELLAAASVALVIRFPDVEDLHRQLLLGRNSWTEPSTSPNARYHIIEAMGLSGNEGFLPILNDVLQHHYHYCPRPHTLRAIEALGSPTDPDERERLLRSISVTPSEDGSQIIITEDKHYGGGSNCIHCEFRPCRINRQYSMGIEDCRLWNRLDPETCGEIVDRKGWGGDVETLQATPPEILLHSARTLLDRGGARLAIPHLCSILIRTDFETTLSAVTWINLARCFADCGEHVLAFIAMREGAKLSNLVGVSDRAEQAELARFVNDPDKFTGLQLPRERKHRLDLRAMGYRKGGLFARALDCYAESNIYDHGRSGGTWLEMGECHQELGELHLAEAFMRLGAHRTTDIEIRLNLLRSAEMVRSLRLTGIDPGLAIDLRAADRAAHDPPNLCS